MTRSFVVAATAMAVAAVVSVVSGTGCQATGVGDPCTPEQEYDPSFLGFDQGEVNLESKSFQCETRLCLVNHFQGRVSCPYGQNADSTPLMGTKPECCCDSSGNCSSPNGDGSCPQGMTGSGCCIPGKEAPVVGTPINGKSSSTVLPNCLDRTADKAVYCSCRCANVNGQTNDGANYCKCPSGFTCTQLVAQTGLAGEQLTGAYCIKTGTDYKTGSCSTFCDPTQGNCGNAQGVQAH